MRPIYLDYNATTPVDPRVLDAMLPYLRDYFGNASSTHAFGYEAHAAIERARMQVASLLCAGPGEVVFTGGGSESNNLAIKGALLPTLARRPHVVTTTTEHPAVLNTLAYLRVRFGVEHTLVPVDTYGRVSAADIEAAIRPETVLVTVMHANNEVGTVQPLADIGRITRSAGVILHVDAAQSTGKLPIDVSELGADLLTIAGHKLYAPKGVGALYIRSGVQIDPIIHGSGQEQGLRAGTENVAGMVALGTAAELAAGDLEEEAERLTALRDRLEMLLRAAIPGLAVNGHPVHRLPNTLNVSFPGVYNQALLASAPGVAASTGAACHSATSEPSSVLLAMGLDRERATGAVRLSLGRMTTDWEVEQAAAELAGVYSSLAPAAASPA